ncbi:MAG: hypothetical protein ACYTG3_13305 [Planctomycetota bacterium]|jgi:hypothetical protein
MTRICCLTLASVLLAGPAPAEDRETAKEAMTRIQEAAARPEHAGFRGLFTDDAFSKARKEQVAKQRLALAKTLQASLITDVRRKGNEAIATLKTQDDVRNRVARELPLRREGSHWRIASGHAYVLPRDTGKSAKVRLTMRTTNRAYGTSAYCFTYVTSDPALCKNRMDIWFCHNGDLHASKNGRITHLGKVSPKKVEGLPLGLAWTRTIAARKGHTYVMHCRDSRDRDFFVKFKVTKLRRGIAELEWSLLATGYGAPTNIHEAQPLLSNDGADGTDGLCGKNG